MFLSVRIAENIYRSFLRRSDVACSGKRYLICPLDFYCCCSVFLDEV